MNLLFRFLWFIAGWTARIIVQLLIGISQMLLPVLLAGIRWIFALMRFSLTASVNGPRQFVDRLASEWTRRLFVLGVSPDHMDNAYRFCRFTIIFLIVLGWTAIALFFEAVLRIYFGVFT